MNPFRDINYLNKPIDRGKDLNFDEIYLDAVNQSDSVLEDERTSLNHRLLLGCLLLTFLVLTGRIAYLQTIRGEEYRNLADGNKLRIAYLLAPRGLILDKSGKTIVGNIPSFELAAVSALLPQNAQVYQQTIDKLSKITGKPADELKSIIDRMQKDSTQPQTVLENLSKDQALILISSAQDFPGFEVQDNPIRDYKDPLAFAHLTGYTGKVTREELDKLRGQNYLLNDVIGKTGIEDYYEEYLRGVPGQKQREIDAGGNIRSDLRELSSTPGNNIETHIDYDLQKVLYDNLFNVLARGRAKKAAAVATNPQTGEVLALISLPSFDSNMFARGITVSEYQSLLNNPNNPFLNRVLSGTYPPGSTVKPMLAIAGLTEGTITPQTKILDEGVIRIGNFTFYGYDPKGLGLMDVYSAIARSSDIFFYTIGGGSPKSSVQGLGPEKLAEWYRKFYLGQALGIDLPSEKDGLVPDPEWKQAARGEQWYLGDTYHVAIGQGDLLVTPLQVNSWTSTIANGGKIMEPHVFSQATSPDGKVLLKKDPKILAEDFLDPRWVKVAADGMRQTVTGGSAGSLDSLTIEVSGKTGTAQFDAKNPGRTHAWFTSYAPSSDPNIALTILVESGGEGSSVAVPIAKQVYEWYVQHRFNQ